MVDAVVGDAVKHVEEDERGDAGDHAGYRTEDDPPTQVAAQRELVGHFRSQCRGSGPDTASEDRARRFAAALLGLGVGHCPESTQPANCISPYRCQEWDS